MRSCAACRCRCGRSLLPSLIIGGGYGARRGVLLTRPALRFDLTLGVRRDSVLARGRRGVSIGVRGARAMSGSSLRSASSTRSDFGSAALRFWVGDMIGITVLTPFLLILLTRRRLPAPSLGVLGLLALIVAALWLVFGFAELVPLSSSSIPFLPVIWTAVRFGLEGVTVGLCDADRSDRRHPSSPSRRDRRDGLSGADGRAVADRPRGRRPGQRAAAHAAAASAESGGAQPRVSGSAPWASSRPRLRTRSTSR